MQPPIHSIGPGPQRVTPRRGRDQRGEGVISMAIAVLIVAALGVLMWVGFQTLWQDTEGNISDQVNQIGG